MSEVLDKIKSRRSIRKYRSDMIPQDKLEKIIEAGTYAATGMGKQSPIIIAVTNKELRDKLSAMNAKIMGVENMDPFYGAPVVLIVLADKSRPTCVYDGSLVMGNLMLEAEEQGIGSCWIHRAKEEFDQVYSRIEYTCNLSNRFTIKEITALFDVFNLDNTVIKCLCNAASQKGGLRYAINLFKVVNSAEKGNITVSAIEEAMKRVGKGVQFK